MKHFSLKLILKAQKSETVAWTHPKLEQEGIKISINIIPLNLKWP